jgi:calcium/calmodulin-dependent protein kinase kinase 2
MVETQNSIKRKYIPKESHEILRGIDSNQNEIINQYIVVTDLGEGSFSSVKLFFDTNTQKNYATKIINKKELEKRKKGIQRNEEGQIIVDNCLKDALREIAILKRIDCPNIIQLREILHDNENNKIFLVMEFAEKGQILEFDEESETFTINSNLLLDDRDPFYSEDEIRDYLRGIVTGISYCKSYS